MNRITRLPRAVKQPLPGKTVAKNRQKQLCLLVTGLSAYEAALILIGKSGLRQAEPLSVVAPLGWVRLGQARLG